MRYVLLSVGMSIVVHEDFKISCFHLVLSTTDSRNLSVDHEIDY